MDMKSETARVRLWLFLALLYALSMCFSCQELKYAVWGITTDARIVSLQKTKTVGSRTRPSRDVLAVRYSWAEEGGVKRDDFMNREMAWQRPENGLVRIDYLPGVKGSRPAGERNVGALAIFIVLTAAMVLVSARLVWEGYRKR